MKDIETLRRVMRSEYQHLPDELFNLICFGESNGKLLRGLHYSDFTRNEMVMWRIASGLIYMHERSDSDRVLKRAFQATMYSLSSINDSQQIIRPIASLIGLIKAISKFSNATSNVVFGDNAILEIEKIWKVQIKQEREKVKTLIDTVCGWSALATDANFNEDLYIDENPDIKSSIQSGSIESGWYHFDNLGRFEGRLVRQYDGEKKYG